MSKKLHALTFDFLCGRPEEVNWENIVSPEFHSHEFIGLVKDILSENKKRFGTCTVAKVNRLGKNVELVLNFETATVNVKINATGELINAIRFDYPKIKGDSFERVEQDLEKIQGQVSAVVRNGKRGTIFSYNSDKQLAIASSFKLFILKVLDDEILKENLRWSDVVQIKAGQISYPSGILQKWPVGTPVTIKTLAILMISESDNTATDVLLDLLGRERMEKYASGNRPFLKTRELFLLKNNFPEFGRKFMKLDEAEKRKLLSKLDHYELKPSDSNFRRLPPDNAIDWHASVDELASLVLSLKDNDILKVNTGFIQESKKWKYIGYKGGHEDGIWQFTYLFCSKKGGWYAVSVTWNGLAGQVPENSIKEIVLRIENLLVG